MARSLALLLLLLLAPLTAWGHPMGTLSTNRSALLAVRPGEIHLLYIVDFAEVQSVPEQQRVDELGRELYAHTRMEELLPRLSLQVDGRPLAWTIEACKEATGEGEGALPVVTLLCDLSAPGVEAGRLRFEDRNFEATVGWREIRVVGDGVEVGEGLPAGAVGVGKMPLPYTTPAEEMTLSVVEATVGAAGVATVEGASQATREADPFAALVTGDQLSPRFILLAMLSALILGAGHALSPGHGKTVVAAYLVGSRGTVGQALLLGLAVTATHVSSVLLLGAVTLWLSEYVVAQELYPWIGVGSGLGVIAVGAGLLRARLRTLRAKKATAVEAVAALVAQDHAHHHHTEHQPAVVGAHSHAEGGWLEHDHGPDGHAHVHRDDRGEPVSIRRLLVLGITGGAVPCPSALVVLLSAIALHRIVFGMLLIVVFSVGLAAVLMGIGVLVVRAKSLLDRFGGGGKAALYLPIGSAGVVMVLGLGIAIQAAREGGLW